ncbi:MAG: ABC transporter substrate-binding protein [Marinobacter sp.]|uniref:ABC transporter substrate-binding protein n=1 Tax=Marinobacter sp. TaxID=50741 RepID=UPI00396F244E
MTREGMERIVQLQQDKNYGSKARSRSTLYGVLLLLFSTLAWCQESDPRIVYLAGSGNPALDQHMTRLLEDSLGKDVALHPLAKGQTTTPDDAPIVTIGPSSFLRVRQANRRVPILAMLVERDFIEDYVTRNPGQISAVYYDVPLHLQARIGKAVLPQATKVAILASTETVGLYEPVVDKLPAMGLQPRVFIVDSRQDLIPTLVRALNYGDFLLAGPDDRIYNPSTIKHILLTTYRRNRIVIGPSQAYVKAGSLASGYAPFSIMAGTASRQLKHFFANGELPAPDYPDQYRVEINSQVARSLNIPLPGKEALEQELDRARAENQEVRQ